MRAPEFHQTAPIGVFQIIREKGNRPKILGSSVRRTRKSGLHVLSMKSPLESFFKG
jgi:hypothetical protein